MRQRVSGSPRPPSLPSGRACASETHCSCAHLVPRGASYYTSVKQAMDEPEMPNTLEGVSEPKYSYRQHLFEL